MIFEDAKGDTIQIGDVILYTMSTNGHAPAMQAGEVSRFSAKSLWVKPVEVATLRPIMVNEGYYRETGEEKTYYAGTRSEFARKVKEYVITGQNEAPEQILPKPEPYRFYIIRKI
jgi:hypothetical protein